MSATPEQLWRESLLIAKHASRYGTEALASLNQDDDEAEERRRLVEGVLFSHSFILTYQAALCGIVLLFAIWHWYWKIDWRRRMRRCMKDDERQDCESTAATGPSHAASGNHHLPVQVAKADESSPLLSSPNPSTRPSRLRTIFRKVHAIAKYQPPNLPLINKLLPSNQTTLLVLLLLTLNLFYATYNIPLPIGANAFIWSDRSALLFVANLPWLYLLGAKNQPLKLLTGYSYEQLNLLHRRLGEWLCVLAVVHTAGMLIVWYHFFMPAGTSLWQYLAHPVVWPGVVAFVCYELLYFTSLASFRQRAYEVFLASHVGLQAGGLGFVYLHFWSSRPYVLVSLVVYLVDRTVFRLLVKSRSVRAELKIMEDEQTLLVSADWPIVPREGRWWSSLLGADIGKGWRPMEHVFITVPDLATRHVVQAHPFTIASAAPEHGQEHAWFNLIIRAYDGFTRDLLEYARYHSSTTLRLDGPYGSSHALEMLRASEIALLVIGGSGIAVAYPLLWTLLHAPHSAAKGSKWRQLGLIWIVHEASHIAWIGHERLDELKAMGVKICVPPPTSKAGRPDVRSLARSMVNDLEAKVPVPDPGVGVVVSGPDGMNRAVRNACARLAWEGKNIDVAVEKYGW
ncbi:ferric reductase-like transmembrane component [Hortaea werneckii]|nr:ferric reductase-like transmembrane component [Hortaea werneckii]